MPTLNPGTIIRTTSEPLSSCLQDRLGVVIRRYIPPGTLPDLNEYLVHLNATSRYPEQQYYIAQKFLVEVNPRGLSASELLKAQDEVVLSNLPSTPHPRSPRLRGSLVGLTFTH